jgi:hypothetical protein
VKRWAGLGGAVALFIALAVPYGRSEGERAVDSQQRGLLATRAAVGGQLLRPTQSVYDPASGLQCLIYGAVGSPLGLELCFDSFGGLIESVNRRGPERISSLRWARGDAPFRISPTNVERAVRNVPPDERQTGLLP